MKISIKKNSVILIFILISLGTLTACFVNVNEDLALSKITGFLWTAVISVIAFAQISKMNSTNNIKVIAIAGYLVRIFLAVFQEYGFGELHTFVSESDQDQFINQAYELFHMDFYNEYSANSYQHMAIYLSKMFHVMGADQLALRTVNIYAWFLGCLILCKIAGVLKSRWHVFVFALYSLLPWDLMLSTNLLREPIKQLFLMLSLLYLLKWTETGSFIDIILSLIMTFPALWMHGGDVAMWGVIFLVYVFWNPKTKKWAKFPFSLKYLLLIVGIISIPIVYNVFVTFFPGKFNGSFSIDYFLGLINDVNKYTHGRTTYVPYVTITNVPQFIYWTAYRMFYFWVSPTPRFWTSIGDAVAFCVDTIPWLLLFVGMGRHCKNGKLSKKVLIVVPIILLFTFVYAWGTLNAGTAMRHRGHLLGMVSMLALLDNKNDLEGKNNHEDTDSYKPPIGIV